jgi:hypothetical protein
MADQVASTRNIVRVVNCAEHDFDPHISPPGLRCRGHFQRSIFGVRGPRFFLGLPTIPALWNVPARSDVVVRAARGHYAVP